jgi:hypothetical protein
MNVAVAIDRSINAVPIIASGSVARGKGIRVIVCDAPITLGTPKVRLLAKKVQGASPAKAKSGYDTPPELTPTTLWKTRVAAATETIGRITAHRTPIVDWR